MSAVSEATVVRIIEERDAALAEIARLREIEEAARAQSLLEHRGDEYEMGRCLSPLCVALRAAMEASDKPTLNEWGRAMCTCGVSVLPENWANHLLSRQPGPHRAALRAALEEGADR